MLADQLKKCKGLEGTGVVIGDNMGQLMERVESHDVE
jgi:hypothetical protein